MSYSNSLCLRGDHPVNGVIIDFEAFTIKDEHLPFDTLVRQLGFVARYRDDFGRINFYNEFITFRELSYRDQKSVQFGNKLHGLYLSYDRHLLCNRSLHLVKMSEPATLLFYCFCTLFIMLPC
ncbi:uncharacterized protein LOC111638736 isoform X1 [Centruroides sculpturatus]|uniref:uncharacterized protein LOC111638736 isoform X1 n=1 Tax=Centruroides sculpturatus TaxID=218467 RepID=UPI000C6EA473|nr:uncharacterized protein LOC111638736 isoform X1 [Centruroides sculpturatus]XP_023240256.1 uncharacterized protein LOC111638736 isoform X1 [Centruroides sculpturatus]